MLLVSESGIWASHCNFSYNGAFFENSKRHLKRLILRDRNHPSVVMWSPENECIPAYKVCGSKYIRDVADLEDKLYELTQVIPALDGSRLISCDGSGDLNGRLPVNSLHYPGYDCPTHREKPITIGEMGSMYYSTPDTVCAELGEAALQSFNGRLEAVSGDAFHNLTGQRKWAAQICVFNLIWYGLEPLPFKDKPLVYDDYTAPGIKPSRITPYLRTLNAGAQADLPDYIPNPVFTTTREAYRPVRFFLENAPSSGFTLENLSFPVTVFNDGRGKAELRLTASLKADGVAQVEKTYPLDSCAFAEDVITLAMPGEAGEGTLVFSLYRNGEVIFSDERTVTLYDRKGLQKEYETLASNLTAAGLQSLTPETASVYAPFLKPGKLRRLFGADCGFTFNKPLDGYYFDDYLNFNAQPLFFDGNGNPVVLVIEENGNPVILSGIDLNKHSDEPQAYALRNMLARYLADNAGDFISAMPAYFYGDADGVAAAMLNELQCEYEVIGEAALRSLLNNKQDRVLIADGKTDLSWLKGISASNFKRVLIMGLTRTPDLFADAFTVTDSACCHLTGGREMKRVGLYGNNLYGLSSGVEEALASRLLCYESADNVILSAAQTDWRMWNHNAEYLKTVSILKAVKESNKNLAALSRHDYAGSAIYISQINFSTVSRKIKHITARILSSLGASLKLRENNELNELLSGGLYSNHVTGMLYRRSAEGEDAAAVNPGLNRVENGNVWGVTRERDDVNGLMALYVYSPQDRTDLLLNPDTVDMSVKAHQGKSVAVYLNGAFQTEGTMLNITSLELRAGWNLIVMKGASFPEVRFRRANLKPSDLLFGLYDNEIIKHNMTKARLESVNQPNNLIGAVSGREHHWRSSTDQHEGVDLTVKFPSPVLTRAVYFNSSTGDGREVYPPYRFKIWAGETDDALTEVYAAQFEDRMHYRQGKVFLRLDDVNASIFKIVLTDNALKPWIVSDLSFLA
jgi:hypothetical protein